MSGSDAVLDEPDADAGFMKAALAEARRTAGLGNVPVGAVIVVDDTIVARAGNLRDVLNDPTAHAELLALSEAGQRLGRWRLDDATMYVTLEPCAMCASAIQQARLKRVVYGALEEKTGAVEHGPRLLDDAPVETRHAIEHAPECAALMSAFFEQLREIRKREAKRGGVSELA